MKILFDECLAFIRSTFEAELADVIPVVKTSIAGTRIIGRLCAGENFSPISQLYIAQNF